MLHRSTLRLAVACGMLVPLVALAAGIFPDVDDSYPFKGQIESLARAGIINGNPDGKFYPERSVNRAEFLKLLYTATKRTPQVLSSCFSDVEHGSWYESYVCDASSKSNGFVQGYSDGKFRPGSPVSRTEALKMTFTVFGLAAPEVTSSDQDLIKFVDISVSAWYSRYIIAAYKNGMLPIAGQSGTRFYPDRELTRGEAAAYIFNASQVVGKLSSSSSSSTDAMTSSSSSSSSVYTDVIKKVAFPFKDTDTFPQRHTISYEFKIDSKQVVHVQTDITGFYQSDVTCRLYLLGTDGFASEYYLGVQTPGKCAINAHVLPGTYQLQLQPTVANATFSVNASAGSTDGNDGFVDAVFLKYNTPITGILEANDLTDWYRFTVTQDTTATFDLATQSSMTCIIYMPPSVDQFGFSGPECGKSYRFKAGDYIVGVGRARNADLQKTATYTVKWQ